MALLLIAAGLLLHPMAESMGALHESVSHPAHDMHGGGSTSAGHGDVFDVAGASDDAPGVPTEKPDALHALLHLAHCCGTAGALPTASMSVVAGLAPRGTLLTDDAQAIGQRWLRGPFRPPIAA